MGILDNLERVHVAVVIDKVKTGGDLGELLSATAVDALMKGIGTDEWVRYMSLFADNKEQLDRLTVEEEGEDPYLRTARAYMVSNAICGGATTGRTGQNVGQAIQDGLPDAPDGTVVKPFDIPPIP